MNPAEPRGLSYVYRDAQVDENSPKNRHLNQHWQTAAQGVALFHKGELFFLELKIARIVLFQGLHLVLNFFVPRLQVLHLLHRDGALPFEREEDQVDTNRHYDDRPAVIRNDQIKLCQEE